MLCNMFRKEVSKEKTSIPYTNNVSKNMKMKLMQLSNFRETNLLGKYLGVPLSEKSLKRSDYQYVMDQITSKLAVWKANQLSFADQVYMQFGLQRNFI